MDTMNLKEVSSALGIHYNTTLKYVSLGLIHAVKIGKSYRVSYDEVERLKRDGVSVRKKVLSDAT